MTTVERHRLRVSAPQREFIECPAKFDLFLGGIGSGKSMAGAIKAVGEIKKGGLGIVVCPTFRMLRDATWRTCLEVWRDRLHLTRQILRGDELRVIFDNGAEAIFRSAEDPERLRGPNADWFMLDEGAQCHPDTWSILIGRLRGEGRTGRGWITTTPKGMNFLYETFVMRANADTHMHRATTADNPFLPVEFERTLRSQYDGPFAAQEIDAEFIADDAAALIPYEWLHAAADRSPEAPTGTPISVGIDVAGPGEALTTCVARRGPDIISVQGWANPDPRAELIDHLRGMLQRGLRAVNVDSIGIGWYVYCDLQDALAPFGVSVNPVNVALPSKALNDAGMRQFANLKAEHYWHLREQFRDGWVTGLEHAELRRQLGSLRYEVKSGLLAIESKEAMAKRGIESPDFAEAAMLCWAEADSMINADVYGQSTEMAVSLR